MGETEQAGLFIDQAGRAFASAACSRRWTQLRPHAVDPVLARLAAAAADPAPRRDPLLERRQLPPARQGDCHPAPAGAHRRQLNPGLRAGPRLLWPGASRPGGPEGGQFSTVVDTAATPAALSGAPINGRRRLGRASPAAPAGAELPAHMHMGGNSKRTLELPPMTYSSGVVPAFREPAWQRGSRMPAGSKRPTRWRRSAQRSRLRGAIGRGVVRGSPSWAM